MHIKIEDQENGDTSVLCIDRDAKTAQILKLVPGHQNLLVQVAQSVGATQLAMVSRAEFGNEHLQTHGFRVAIDVSVFVKEL